MRLVSLVLLGALAVPAGAEIVAGRFVAGATQPGAKRRMERRHDAEEQRLLARHAREMAACRQASSDCSDLAAAHKREQKQLEKQHAEDHRSFAAALRVVSDNTD
jgi:hypothetical protein